MVASLLLFLTIHFTIFLKISVQFSHSVVSGSLQPYELQQAGFLSITNSWSLLKLMSIELVMPSNHLILCHPLLLPPSIFPSIRWPKYWSFSFSISPSYWYSGLISFRMYRLELLALQGTFNNLLQHHSSRASVLQHSTFFIVQVWHLYMTPRKTIALTRQIFVGK